jgi:cytochrome c oxidase subunit II
MLAWDGGSDVATRQFLKSLAVGCGLLLSAVLVRADRGAARAQDAQVVDVSAERFSFTPSEIRAKAGVPLEIRLESEDTDHGFRILGTKIDVRIPKRNKGRTTVRFEPAEPGRYTFECSHVCGAGHSFMRGTIVVTQ